MSSGPSKKETSKGFSGISSEMEKPSVALRTSLQAYYKNIRFPRLSFLHSTTSSDKNFALHFDDRWKMTRVRTAEDGKESREKITYFNLKDLLRDEFHSGPPLLLVEGQIGMGQSTMSKYLAREQLQKERIVLHVQLPLVKLKLKAWAGKAPTVEQYWDVAVKSALILWMQLPRGMTLSIDEVKEQLAAIPILWIFDGFDEISHQEDAVMQDFIDKFVLQRSRTSSDLVMLSSRQSRGRAIKLPPQSEYQYARLEICKWNEADVEKYIKGHLNIGEQGTKPVVEDNVGKIKQIMRKPGMAIWRGVPFMYDLLCYVLASRGSMLLEQYRPHELLATVLDLSWARFHGETKKVEAVLNCAKEIAWRSVIGGNPVATTEWDRSIDAIGMLRDAHWIEVIDDCGTLKFVHRVFAEFFVAQLLFENLGKESLSKFSLAPEHRVILSLLGSMVSGENCVAGVNVLFDFVEGEMEKELVQVPAALLSEESNKVAMEKFFSAREEASFSEMQHKCAVYLLAELCMMFDTNRSFDRGEFKNYHYWLFIEPAAEIGSVKFFNEIIGRSKLTEAQQHLWLELALVKAMEVGNGAVYKHLLDQNVRPSLLAAVEADCTVVVDRMLSSSNSNVSLAQVSQALSLCIAHDKNEVGGLLLSHYCKSQGGNFELTEEIVEGMEFAVQHYEEMLFRSLIAVSHFHEMLQQCLLVVNVARVSQHGKVVLLHAASITSNPILMKRLVEQSVKIDINHRWSDTKTTAFWLSCRIGSSDLVSLLKNISGIDVNAQDNDGETPFYAACCSGHAEVVKILKDIPRIDMNTPNNVNWTPAHAACAMDHGEVVKILKDIPGIDFRPQKEFYTACMMGHAKVLRVLKDIPSIDANAQDNDGETPFYLASFGRNSELVKHLEDIPDVNVYTPGVDIQTPFFAACRWGRAEIVKILQDIPGIMMNAPNAPGWTPFYEVCWSGDVDRLNLLKDIPGINVNAPDTEGATPFYAACYRGHTEVVKILTGIPGIDMNSPDNYGQTPFYAACRWGQNDIVKILKSIPRLRFNDADKHGLTPFNAACCNGHVETVRILKDFSEINVNTPNKEGESPFYSACRWGHSEIVNLLKDIAGIDVNAPDNDGQTPFYAACNCEAVVEILKDIPGIITYSSPASPKPTFTRKESYNRKAGDFCLREDKSFSKNK